MIKRTWFHWFKRALLAHKNSQREVFLATRVQQKSKERERARGLDDDGLFVFFIYSREKGGDFFWIYLTSPLSNWSCSIWPHALSLPLSLSSSLSFTLGNKKKNGHDSLFQGGLHKKTRAFTHPHKVPTHLNKNGTRCGRHFYAQDQRGEPRPPERRQEESQKQTGETPPIR